MKKIILPVVLLLFFSIPQEGFAKLNPPTDLNVHTIGQRSATVQWQWTAGGGTITDFELLVGPKEEVSSCIDTEDWRFTLRPGSGERAERIQGLTSGETYCWKIMARETSGGDESSELVYGPEFTTNIDDGGAVCGDGPCEAGEDPTSCYQDCGVGDDPPTVNPSDLNPISSTTLPQVLEKVLNFLFGISIVIVPIIIVYGGFLLLMAQGDPEKISKGRTILLWAVIAFAIILLARGLPAVLRGLL